MRNMKQCFKFLLVVFVTVTWVANVYAGSLEKFSSEENIFSFDYPSEWNIHTHEIVEGNEVVVLITPEKDPDGERPDPIATFFVIVEKSYEMASIDDVYAEAIVPLVEEGSMTFIEEGKGSVAGQKALWYMAKPNVGPFDQIIKSYLFILSKERYCAVTIAVKAEQFDKYEKTFEQIIKSLALNI